jgi:hypothetical protein
MSAPARLLAFAALLAAVFGGALLAGRALDAPGPAEATRGGHDEEPAGHVERADEPAPAGAHAGTAAGGDAHGEPAAAAAALPGLAAADAGVRLVLERGVLPRPGRSELRFRVVDAGGRPVRDFELEQTKRMHLIVVRRDGAGFQHLHPRMRADGTWVQPLRLDAAGTYRVIADFRRAGRQTTLGHDLHVGGEVEPAGFPAPARAARAADLAVDLDAPAARAGRPVELAFGVRRGGRAVDAELEPYLGARGHLVVLREGDLAYLHTHPSGDRLAFEATFPSAGRYRAFVQFAHRGRVRTAAFTVEVAP